MEAGPVPDSEFPFFVPSDLLHASRRRVRFFLFPAACLRAGVSSPADCRGTVGGGCFFCHRRAELPLPGRVEAAGFVVGRGGRCGVAQARFEGR